MDIDPFDRLLTALGPSSGFVHPLVLDIVIGIVFGIGIGLALASLRSDAP